MLVPSFCLYNTLTQVIELKAGLRVLAFLCQGEGDAGVIAQPSINVFSSCPNHSKLCVAKPSRLQYKHKSSRVIGTVNTHPKQGSVCCVFPLLASFVYQMMLSRVCNHPFCCGWHWEPTVVGGRSFPSEAGSQKSECSPLLAVSFWLHVCLGHKGNVLAKARIKSMLEPKRLLRNLPSLSPVIQGR